MCAWSIAIRTHDIKWVHDVCQGRDKKCHTHRHTQYNRVLFPPRNHVLISDSFSGRDYSHNTYIYTVIPASAARSREYSRFAGSAVSGWLGAQRARFSVCIFFFVRVYTAAVIRIFFWSCRGQCRRYNGGHANCALMINGIGAERNDHHSEKRALIIEVTRESAYGERRRRRRECAGLRRERENI